MLEASDVIVASFITLYLCPKRTMVQSNLYFLFFSNAEGNEALPARIIAAGIRVVQLFQYRASVLKVLCSNPTIGRFS